MKNLIFWLALLASAPLLADGDHHVTGIGQEKLGTANFAVSCSPAAQLEFNRAVAMLHSFWYDEAKKTFAHIAELDSDCVMAHWGIAMSLYRQLWATPPTQAELQEGREALTRAQALPVKTDRESLYLDAVAQLYRSEDADYGRRKQAYPKGINADKKIKGRKRNLVVDTLGLLLAVSVCAANLQDRDTCTDAVASAVEKVPHRATVVRRQCLCRTMGGRH